MSVLAPLARFDAHALSELGDAALMDRVDTEFVVPRALLPELLEAMRDHYSALEIGGLRDFRYLNDYLDGPDHRFYRDHHVGRARRFKLRRRTYLDDGGSFLEVKRRTVRGRTVKVRAAFDVAGGGAAPGGFLARAGIGDASRLRVVQRGAYRRVALADPARGERLTVDRDLVFVGAAAGRTVALGPWAVIELKQARRDGASPFLRWARARGVRPCPFSKYCMGVYLTGPEGLARNRFHETARRVGLRRRRPSPTIGAPPRAGDPDRDPPFPSQRTRPLP